VNSKNRLSAPRSRGFTLVELAFVITVVCLVMAVLLPVRASSKTKARSIRCLDNMRQVSDAVAMFSHDNHDLLPPNPNDGTTIPGFTWCTGVVSIGGTDEFDPDLMADPQRCLIAPYITTNVSVYHCTADPRFGKFDGAGLYPTSPLIGKIVPSARTISMSQAVGTIDPCFSATGSGHCGTPNLPVKGPWLTGTSGGNNAINGPYRTYGKTSQMVLPSPAQLLVMTEEAPYSINDGGFAAVANLASLKWIDYPSPLHNNGCVISFGDSHVEFHKWQGQSLNSTTLPTGLIQPNDPDLLWVAQHISAKF
jgi:prepilin-type N-terminal cleavage/methylation domain-containing protein